MGTQGGKPLSLSKEHRPRETQHLFPKGTQVKTGDHGTTESWSSVSQRPSI